MTYHFAVYRGALLMVRTLTRAKAARLAQTIGGVVVAETFVKGGHCNETPNL